MRTVIKNKSVKVLMAMSGGVDSSVAAALLLAEGYDVTGAYMINYDTAVTDNTLGSCWVPDYRDAVRVAAKLGIPLLKLDFTKEYKKMVLDYMFAEYSKGNTPNPDVMCNKFVKFGVWLEKAKELGFTKLATGHYADLKKTKDKTGQEIFHLQMAKDDNKDQTYFLHQLGQEQLKYTLFPLGKYSKPEVRQMAQKLALPTADKEESMGICFVGEVPMKEFLSKKIKSKKGKIIDVDGRLIGEHDGLSFYTIGQRHGLEQMGGGKPLFVVEKRQTDNVLVVGYEDEPKLFKKEINISEVNWVLGKQPKIPFDCQIRLRHRQELQEAKIVKEKNKLLLKLKKPQRAVAPGQFAVFYKNGECLGGGIIE